MHKPSDTLYTKIDDSSNDKTSGRISPDSVAKTEEEHNIEQILEPLLKGKPAKSLKDIKDFKSALPTTEETAKSGYTPPDMPFKP